MLRNSLNCPIRLCPKCTRLNRDIAPVTTGEGVRQIALPMFFGTATSCRAFFLFVFALMLAGLSREDAGVQAAEGAQIIDYYGYDDCIRLHNESTEVILCPAAGGRVLRYALAGKNVLYLPDGDEGWIWDGTTQRAPMNAGRFDIGPEKTVPRRPVLWQGRWNGKITGDRAAVLISQDDQSTGVRLERKFMLSESSSELKCTQRIINVADSTVEYCHWSRTFAAGKGVCVIPLSEPSRFPNGYVRYDSGDSINFRPADEHIRRDGNFLVVSDHPRSPKLGFDSYAGWLAYSAPTDLLFVKKFPTYPDRVYNEVAGLTISVWYPADKMVELEPIGPRERLKPGAAASFTETWFLLDRKFEGEESIDCAQIEAIVEQL